jgi:hypothetical protein
LDSSHGKCFPLIPVIYNLLLMTLRRNLILTCWWTVDKSASTDSGSGLAYFQVKGNMSTSRTEQFGTCLLNERKFLVSLGICLLSFGALVILITDTEKFNNTLDFLNSVNNKSGLLVPRAQFSTNRSYSEHGSLPSSYQVKAIDQNVSQSQSNETQGNSSSWR